MTPLRPPVRPLAVPGAEHVVRWQPGEWMFRVFHAHPDPARARRCEPGSSGPSRALTRTSAIATSAPRCKPTGAVCSTSATRSAAGWRRRSRSSGPRCGSARTTGWCRPRPRVRSRSWICGATARWRSARWARSAPATSRAGSRSAGAARSTRTCPRSRAWSTARRTRAACRSPSGTAPVSCRPGRARPTTANHSPGHGCGHGSIAALARQGRSPVWAADCPACSTR